VTDAYGFYFGQPWWLAAGVEMALAITPPDSATRIVLVSEGNETEGDLKETAETAAANKIPIDVLPLRYRYVNDLGGGLIMTGGPHAFGAGGWINSPVAEVLPVDLDPPQKKQMPSGALCLVIDRSGSMTGLKVEICKVAATAAVRLLSKVDKVGVVTFDAVSEWQVPMRTADNKAAICHAIDQIHAGGGTGR
jgi:uncharacterized membrane protein